MTTLNVKKNDTAIMGEKTRQSAEIKNSQAGIRRTVAVEKGIETGAIRDQK